MRLHILAIPSDSEKKQFECQQGEVLSVCLVHIMSRFLDKISHPSPNKAQDIISGHTAWIYSVSNSGNDILSLLLNFVN